MRGCDGELVVEEFGGLGVFFLLGDAVDEQVGAAHLDVVEGVAGGFVAGDGAVGGDVFVDGGLDVGEVGAVGGGVPLGGEAVEQDAFFIGPLAGAGGIGGAGGPLLDDGGGHLLRGRGGGRDLGEGGGGNGEREGSGGCGNKSQDRVLIGAQVAVQHNPSSFFPAVVGVGGGGSGFPDFDFKIPKTQGLDSDQDTGEIQIRSPGYSKQADVFRKIRLSLDLDSRFEVSGNTILRLVDSVCPASILQPLSSKSGIFAGPGSGSV